MALTLGQLYRHAQDATDLDSFGDLVTLSEVVERAGTHLVSMRNWSWLQRQTTTIALVAGQPWAALPPDVDAIVSIDVTNSLVQSIRPTTWEQLLRLRTSHVEHTTWDFWYTVAHRLPADDGDDELEDGQEPYPIMELWPTPTVSDPTGFTIAYTSRWPSYYGSESQRIAIPQHAEALLIELVRRIARGYQEEGDGSVAQRLEGVDQSALFRAAAMADARLIQEWGALRNGAVNQGGIPPYRYNFGLVADPA